MEKLLVVLVIILAIVGIAQIAKVYQLSTKLSGKREEDVSPVSNRVNANLMLIFVFALFAFFIWELVAYRDVLLPVAASKHGAKVDVLWDVNWWILFTAFFLVNFLLFYFAYKYAYDPNRKAYYFPHNNKLELVWTVIPSIVLAVIVIYGLNTWNQITAPASEDALEIELFGRQFDWTARYAGDDGVMGESNFTMITGTNPLGLISDQNIQPRIDELQSKIDKDKQTLRNSILPDNKVAEIEDEIGVTSRHLARVLDFKTNGKEYTAADDDIVVKGEFHIPVNREVTFQIRASDVIHSAYMPHFRAQMNAVPGMTTHFKFIPTITTDSMRTITGDPNFDYILLCNKVCGSAHYNMQMTIVVDSEDDYDAWLVNQKTFGASLVGENQPVIEPNKVERLIAEKQLK